MIAALGLTGRLFTLGAMHAQKNSRQPWPPVTICWFNLRTIRPICSMPPMPSPRAPSQPTSPLQLPSADPATSGAASRSSRRQGPGRNRVGTLHQHHHLRHHLAALYRHRHVGSTRRGRLLRLRRRPASQRMGRHHPRPLRHRKPQPLRPRRLSQRGSRPYSM